MTLSIAASPRLTLPSPSVSKVWKILGMKGLPPSSTMDCIYAVQWGGGTSATSAQSHYNWHPSPTTRYMLVHLHACSESSRKKHGIQYT